MSINTLRDVTSWLSLISRDQITITFHGGEPLLAGAGFYKEAFPMLSGILSKFKPTFAIQTNLWKMTPEIAEVLAEYNVPIGSSIDGPEEITDSQRGLGYFKKTMEGYQIAKEHGLNVRFICTFTNISVKKREEIFNFFKDEGLVMKLHPALPSLKGDNPLKWALSPEEYGDLLLYLLDKYLENINTVRVMNIDDLFKCVFTRHGTVCTYADCMGSTYAIGPDGNIYPCYRFVGMPDFVMGNVSDKPTLEELNNSPAGQKLFKFKAYVDKACADCKHIRYCRGGCPYNAMAPSNGETLGVDPHCTAYSKIFDEISNRINEEMYGTENSPFTKRRNSIMSLVQKILE